MSEQITMLRTPPLEFNVQIANLMEKWMKNKGLAK